MKTFNITNKLKKFVPNHHIKSINKSTSTEILGQQRSRISRKSLGHSSRAPAAVPRGVSEKGNLDLTRIN